MFLDSLEKKEFTLRVIIDQLNTFDTVDHSMLLEKEIKLYGITDKNFVWFQSYLSHKKHYIHIRYR